jgi:hypothetical protein
MTWRSRASARAPRGAALISAVIALAILLATTDERSFGVIPDGKQMLSAAAAISRFGEIGISRDLLKPSPQGAGGSDAAVSSYGMLPSLVETIPMLLARGLHALAPGAPSTPLFVLVPILCLAFAAGAAARALVLLGLSPPLAAAMGLALPFATPLWSYAGSDFSEALQVAVLSLLLLGVVELRARRQSRRWQIVAGTAAGLAVLTKSLLLVAVAPLLLSTLTRSSVSFLEGEDRDRKRRKGRHHPVADSAPGPAAPAGAARPWALLISFAVCVLLWAFLDFLRFGRLLGGYRDETFSYPLVLGLLRLTIFPNKGLLLYAPVVVLSPLGFVLLQRRDTALARGLAAWAIAILATSAAWWTWDGSAGWGPRLLVPLFPPLFLFAGLAVARGANAVRAAGVVLLGLGIAVNGLGALMPFSGVYALASLVPPQPIEEARAAGTLNLIQFAPDGKLLANSPRHLALTPAWSPLVIHARILARRAAGAGDFSFPDLTPSFVPAWPPQPAPALVACTSPLAWAFWGRSFVSPLPGLVDPYRQAMRDQAVRAIDEKEFARASRLSRELMETGGKPPDPQDVALAAEAELASANIEEAGRLLAKSPEPCHPWINFVRAERESDVPCLPEPTRGLFLQGVKNASGAGLRLTGWARALRSGIPGT